jgi:phage tail protein X
MKTTKKLVGSLFLSLILVTAISCSSNDNKDDGASADVAEATSDLDGTPQDGQQAAQDGQQPPADDQNAPPAEGDQNQAAADGTTPPPADGGDAAKNPSANNELAALDAPPDANGQGGDMAANDQGATPPADPNAAPADPNAPPAADPGAPTADAGTPPPAAPADASAPPPPATDTAAAPPAGGDSFAGAAVADSGDAPAPKKSAPLAHIKDSPFTKGGQNLNTVYIARDGDTLDSISQKLFGEDRSKQLKKGNPTLKRGVKTGDKVYFNSPNPPEDKEKMMTVYEDQGLPPSVYTSKDGDTLKSLSQEWYGTEGSYKEIYAINKSLTSTKDLPPGTELQYWPASANVAVYGAKKEADVAQNTPPPPADAAPAPGAPPGGPGSPNGMPPGGPNGMPPGGMNQPPNMAANNMQPPGAPGANGAPGMPPAAGMTDPNQPPGMNPPGAPGDMNGAPAPGMPPGPGHHKTKDLSATGGMDKDTIFYAGLAGILLISSALWFALRRRRSRNSGVTQI